MTRKPTGIVPTDREIAAGNVRHLSYRMYVGLARGRPDPMPEGAWRDMRDRQRAARLRRIKRMSARRFGR